ncbi:MAG: ComF family protein [Nitrospirae bacterium]|nr:ComF family protein [Nitrospirota bacterium]
MRTSFLKNLLNFLLPPTCHICKLPIKGYSNPYICRICWKKIRLIDDPVCPCCGLPFKSEVALIKSPDFLCGECREKRRYFTKAIAVGVYEGTLSEAIHILKYQKRQAMAKYLNAMVTDVLLQRLFDSDIIIPVPLHKKRLSERGFNQSLLIAHHISKRFSIPLCIDGLQRIRWTRPQIELTKEERLKNVRGAFVVGAGFKPVPTIKGKKIILVDDVYTTGATVNECAKVLKKGGAKDVVVFTIARVGG